MNILHRIIRFPLTRIVIALVFVIAAVVVAQGGLHAVRVYLFKVTGPPSLPFKVIEALVLVLAVDQAYRLYVRLVERRPVDELGLAGAPRELGLGALLGCGLQAATIGVLWLLGNYHVRGFNDPIVLVAAFVPSMVAGYVEEVITRGIIFRITEDGLGSWLALVLSSLFFGFAHAWNPGATVTSSAAIALEAGVLLGIAFMWTRRLWFVVGLHFAWNFTQGGIFGATVSGLKLEGLLQGELSGAEALTGGAFGPEASVIAVLLCPLIAVALGVAAVRQGHVVAPFWARRETPPPTPPTEPLPSPAETA